MFLTEEALQRLASRGPENSFLRGLALHRPHTKPIIDSLNELHASLPEFFHKNPDFNARIGSADDSSFRGAFGEMLSYHFLAKYFDRIILQPKIGNQTPDFYCLKDNIATVAEVFCIGETKQDALWRIGYGRVQKELSGLIGKFHLTQLGNPVLDPMGGIFGLRDAVAEKIESLSPDFQKGEFLITTVRGARCKFLCVKRKEDGKMLGGSVGNVVSGQPEARLIENNLIKKRDKYRLPFIAVCVTAPHSAPKKFETIFFPLTGFDKSKYLVSLT